MRLPGLHILLFLSAAFARAEDPLLTVRAIRALAPAEAATMRPVTIKGVVTYADPKEPLFFFIQDETAGIYVTTHTPWGMRRGNLIEIQGVTGPGEFAPVIQGETWEDRGSAPLPEPMPARYSDLVGGPADSQFVEVRGVIRSVQQQSSGHTQIDVVTEGHRISSLLPIGVKAEAEGLVDAEVRVHGVCITHFYDRRWIAAWMRLNSIDQIIVERPPPVPAFALKVQPAASLLQFNPTGQWLHRVRVQGIVTGSRQPRTIFLRDESGPIEVYTAADTTAEIGDRLDVVGFVRGSELHPVVEDAIYRPLGRGPVPVPQQSTLVNIFAGKESGNLITVTGRLVDRMRGLTAELIVVEMDERLFQAHLPLDTGTPPPAWPVGSRIQLTGICIVPLDQTQHLTFGYESLSFQLLLRTPTDIEVMAEPPWWTAERIGVLLLIVLGGLLAAVAWAASLHSRVRKQTALIEQKVERHAVLEERTRIARDLHDTLTQSLAGVAFQLEGVRGQLHDASTSVREHFSVALHMLRHSLAEARRSVMNLRALGLEDSDLLHALEETTRPHVADSGVQLRFHRDGAELPIPTLIEHHLLRLGQEAIANALQHGEAQNITVTLHQQVESTTLEIRDDGRGFDTAQASPPGHFGLVGMRERANLLRAKLDIITQPGHGSTIRVIVPATHETPSISSHV